MNKLIILLCALFLASGYAAGHAFKKFERGDMWQQGYNRGERQGRHDVLEYAYKKRLLLTPEKASPNGIYLNCMFVRVNIKGALYSGSGATFHACAFLGGYTAISDEGETP